MSRVVVWFSCGAASAVAAKLAAQKYGKADLRVVYCDTKSEHPSNRQFLKDVESWIQHPIEILSNDAYKNHFDVFRKNKFIKSPKGAPCTTELKKVLRYRYQEVDDIQIFGYTSDETDRIQKFRANNPDIITDMILVENNMTHHRCLGVLQSAGINLPYMYQPQKSGSAYNHNNCIGCPKGGMGYWNKIRVDFPEHFAEMAKIEREIGHSVCSKELPYINEQGKKVRLKVPVFLDELPPDAGRFADEPPIACDMVCGMVAEQLNGEEE